MSEIILCVGPIRSGSTWQYNVVRTVVRTAGNSPYGAWCEDYDPARPETVHVVKSHSESPAPFRAALTTFRDLRGVIASARRMGWAGYTTPKEVVGVLERYLAHLERWEPVANRTTRYEEIASAPIAEISRIAASIGYGLSCAMLAKIKSALGEMEPPLAESGRYDRETLLHPGHIGRIDSPLDDQTRYLIEDRFGCWLRARGYL